MTKEGNKKKGENGKNTRFSSTYQPEKGRGKGRVKGFKNTLREVFEGDGFFRLDADTIQSIGGVNIEDVLKVFSKAKDFRPEMGIVLKVSSNVAAALRISEFIGSSNETVALKSIEFMADRLEGKPDQSHKVESVVKQESVHTLDVRDIDPEDLDKLGDIFQKINSNK